MSNESPHVSENSPEKRTLARSVGRPRNADQTIVLSFRVPASLAARVDSWAGSRGLNKNQAGAELLQLALNLTPPVSAGGYNPLKGCFE